MSFYLWSGCSFMLYTFSLFKRWKWLNLKIITRYHSYSTFRHRTPIIFINKRRYFSKTDIRLCLALNRLAFVYFSTLNKNFLYTMTITLCSVTWPHNYSDIFKIISVHELPTKTSSGHESRCRLNSPRSMVSTNISSITCQWRANIIIMSKKQ